jgi:hypothetical protein
MFPPIDGNFAAASQLVLLYPYTFKCFVLPWLITVHQPHVLGNVVLLRSLFVGLIIVHASGNLAYANPHDHVQHIVAYSLNNSASGGQNHGPALHTRIDQNGQVRPDRSTA